MSQLFREDQARISDEGITLMLEKDAAALQERVIENISRLLPRYQKAKKKFLRLHRYHASVGISKSLPTTWWKKYHQTRDALGRVAKKLFEWQKKCRHLGHPTPPNNETQPDSHCPGCHYSKGELYELRNLGVFG